VVSATAIQEERDHYEELFLYYGEEKQAHCPEVGLRGCRHYSALYNSGHHYLLQTLCEALEEARTGFGSRVMSAEELWQHT
jgi:hypothetical protein